MIRPKRFVNYKKYTLFMSHMAHELKRLGADRFIEKYKPSMYKGLYRRYLTAYIEYIHNQKAESTAECLIYPKVLIVEPYVYNMYFKCHDKSVLKEAMQEAIPEFLKQGLLITSIQEPVDTSHKINNSV